MAVPAPFKRSRPEAVTDVQLVWSVPPPVLPLRRAGRSTPVVPPPTLQDLSAAARAIAGETTFEGAAERIEREACRLTGCVEALCVAFDWARRRAWTSRGELVAPQVKELVIEVAGRGRRQVLGSALVAPIGPAPARAVLALRRRSGGYAPADLAAITALTGGVATTLARLLAR